MNAMIFLLIVLSPNGSVTYQRFETAELCKIAMSFTAGMTLDRELKSRGAGSTTTMCVNLETKKEV